MLISDWSSYVCSSDRICEIEQLFIEQIRRARRFVYIETQYFASRAIAEVICERLLEPGPPEFLVVNPLSAHGWLEQVAMDTARVELQLGRASSRERGSQYG